MNEIKVTIHIELSVTPELADLIRKLVLSLAERKVMQADVEAEMERIKRASKGMEKP